MKSFNLKDTNCVLMRKRFPQVWQLLLALFTSIVGYFIGSLFKDGKLLSTFSSEDSMLKFANFDEGYKFNSHLPNIYVASNPRGAERLPPEIIRPYSDFFLRGCVGNEPLRRTKYLLTLTVGIHQKEVVNKMISKFSENFTIVLFHYDGKIDEWDEYEWSQRAIHISALRQAKWWYAKRFLHPDIVAQYEYIFIWDEDFGLENFNAEEYIKVVRKYGLEISQPAVTSTKGLTYQMTVKRTGVEVHWEAVENNCHSLFLPPCAGFVEIMAPVISGNSWNCVWNMIQNDLVHGWGLDFQLYRCVEKPHQRIGVVDSQWIEHLVLPTLSLEESSINRKRSRLWIRSRSHAEMVEFGKRMASAEQHNQTKPSS